MQIYARSHVSWGVLRTFRAHASGHTSLGVKSQVCRAGACRGRDHAWGGGRSLPTPGAWGRCEEVRVAGALRSSLGPTSRPHEHTVFLSRPACVTIDFSCNGGVYKQCSACFVKFCYNVWRPVGLDGG